MTTSRAHTRRRVDGVTAVVGALAGRSCGVGAVFLLTLLIGRELGAAEGGYFFLFQAWTSFLTVVLGMGLPVYVLRSVVSSDEDGRPEESLRIVRRSVSAVVVATTLLLILLFLARVPILKVFAPPGAPSSLSWLAGAAAGLLIVVRLYAEAIKGRFCPNRSVLVQFALVPGLAVAIFVAFLAFLPSPDSTMAMSAYVLAGVLGVGVGSLAWHRTGTPRDTRVTPVTPLPPRRGALALLWLVAILEVSYETIPYLILGRIARADEVGQFGAAMRVAAVAGVGLTAVGAIYGPKFAKAFHRCEPVQMAHCLRSSQIAAVASYVPWLVPLVVFPERLMGMFGADFRGGAQLLVILAFGQLINAATGVVNVFLQLARQEPVSLAISAASMMLMIVGGIICGRVWGVTGVGGQYAAVLAGRNILLWFAVRRIIRR